MLCYYYQLLVKVINYVRIIPKLEEWCDIINNKFPYAEKDTLFSQIENYRNYPS